MVRYTLIVHIISRKKLQEYWKTHKDSKKPLETWYKKMNSIIYKNLDEVRKTYSSADPVGNKTVFNIKGNTYRLITSIHYNRGKVYIRKVLTHAEYDKGDWKND